MMTESKLLVQIRQKLKANRYEIIDFLRVSEYSISELCQKNRNPNVIIHRQLLAVWSLLSGKGVVETGVFLSQDHSTISYSVKQIHNYLFNCRYKPFETLLTKVIEETGIAIIGPEDDIVKSYNQLESYLYMKFPWLYNEQEFKCVNLLISSKLGINSKRCVQQCNSCK